MPAEPSKTATRNRILKSLSSDDLRLIEGDLVAVDLPLRKELEAPRKPIEAVYFIESGFASVVADAKNRGIEVGLIGREGMSGLAVVMGTDRSPNRTFMQSAGRGRRLSVPTLARAMAKSTTLHRTLLKYGHTFFVQTSQTALANGRGKIEQRLARWLCMAHDRAEGDELDLTHEFLSIMLGVRRPGVTMSLESLENAGLIKTKRGMIMVVDRTGLEEASDGTYGAPEAEFQRMFG